MKKNKGVVLLLAIGTAAILSLLGGIFFSTSLINQYFAEKYRRMSQAMHNAEAGIERALFDLRQDFINDPDFPSWADGTINGLAFGPHLDGFYNFPYVGTDLNEGIYVVQLRNVSGKDRNIWIRSTGTVGGVNQSIRVYASIKNLSIWSNAVFAGIGQEGGYINGHSEIHGSVHLLGQGLAEGENAIDLTGGGYLSNNYESKNLTEILKDRLPSIMNEANLETLNAELRVKQGMVGLGGDSSVGAPDDPGNDRKETFDGVYVNDGFDNPSSVYSDNGWDNEYDLGDNLPKPSLNDPYEGYDSYFDFYNNNALILEGNVNLVKGVAFPLVQDGKGNSIQMDGDGNLLVTGIIYIKGNLDIGKQGGGVETMSYKGKSSILARGSVSVNVTLLAEKPFPQENILGIMAGENMVLGQDPHSDIMGLFYAQQNITIKKQTNIAGTIVADTFTMDQVPAIFQVPATLDHLPPHIIGGDPFWLTSVVSWQKE